MSQQALTHEGAALFDTKPWWSRLTWNEKTIMKKVHDYQEGSQPWRKYGPSEMQLRERYEYYVFTQTVFADFQVLDFETWKKKHAQYPGVLLKALESWMLQQGMTREAFQRSIMWMIGDPDVPLVETGTDVERRVAIRW